METPRTKLDEQGPTTHLDVRYHWNRVPGRYLHKCAGETRPTQGGSWIFKEPMDWVYPELRGRRRQQGDNTRR